MGELRYRMMFCMINISFLKPQFSKASRIKMHPPIFKLPNESLSLVFRWADDVQVIAAVNWRFRTVVLADRQLWTNICQSCVAVSSDEFNWSQAPLCWEQVRDVYETCLQLFSKVMRRWQILVARPNNVQIGTRASARLPGLNECSKSIHLSEWTCQKGVRRGLVSFWR
jgi:hypothetical protein